MDKKARTRVEIDASEDVVKWHHQACSLWIERQIDNIPWFTCSQRTIGRHVRNMLQYIIKLLC